MTMTKTLKKLARKLDDASTSTAAVRVVHRIVCTQDPDAIAVLAAALDWPGPVGEAAVEGLSAFGQLAAAEMRRTVARSLDEDAIRNAHRVLAALGDRFSARAVDAVCWADLEEDDAAAVSRSHAPTKTNGPETFLGTFGLENRV